MENLIGKLIENYRVVSVLGKGGMGIVYKALDTKLDRYVAIKMLSSQIVDKERFIERFKREAKNQARLSHPNIVTVHGFIEYANLLGIVMEYVEGESLEKVIERQGRFNLYDVIYIIKQLLLGIGYAHSKGFIHRDIKPSNIILNKEGITKIMDFGISKSVIDKNMTKTGSKIGTVYYMSPEQVRGEEVTNRSDIYSIGCTAYEMIIGVPPFDFQSEYEVMEGHLRKSAPRVTEKMSGMPEQVDKIILKAMEKNASNRYSSCEEMYNDVQELDKHVSKFYTSYFNRSKPRSTKYKAFAVGAFVLAGIVLIALSYFVYNQVSDLVTSNQLDKFKKYSIQQLFSGENKKYNFKEITKVETGLKNNLNSIAIVNDKFAVAVGDSGAIIVSTDNGKSWQRKNLKKNIVLTDVVLFPNGKGLVVGDSSSVLFSNNYFDSLSTIPIDYGYKFFNIKFLNDYTGFITGNKGLILKSSNGGVNWSKMTTNSSEVIFDLAFFDSKVGFAVGWNGTVLHTSNGGNSWSRFEIPKTDNYLKSITLNENGVGLIVGGDGIILRTIDFGKTWEKVETKITSAFQKVKFLTDDYAVIIGGRGNILVTKDKGETWNFIDSQILSNLNGMAINSYGQVYFVGVTGMMFKLQ